MKPLPALSLVVAICAVALACAPASILLVNLKTNDLRECPTHEDGDACIKRLEDLGYVRVDRLTPAQKASVGLSLPY